MRRNTTNSPRVIKGFVTARHSERAAESGTGSLSSPAPESEPVPLSLLSDATLRDLARCRPANHEQLLRVHGIGAKKSAEYGADLLSEICDYCRQSGLAMDVDPPPARHDQRFDAAADELRPISAAKRRAFAMFREGKPLDAVREAAGRAHSTSVQYLVEFIAREGICDPSAWIDPAVFDQIRTVCATAGIERLKPIFDALNGAVDYDQIRIAVACLRNASCDAAIP